MQLSTFRKWYKDAEDARLKELAVASPFPPFGDLDDPWKVYLDAYRDPASLWKALGKWMPGWKSRPAAPFVFTVVEQYTTMLTDARPIPQVIADDPDDAGFAETLKPAWNKWWEDQAMEAKITAAVKESRLFSLGWKRLDHTDTGEVCSVIHPEAIFVDPNMTAYDYLTREPEYLIYEYKSPVKELQAAYPKVDFTDFDPKWDAKTKASTIQMPWNNDRQNMNDVANCKVYEVWYQDASFTDIDEPIAGTSSVQTVRKSHFPNGCRSVIAGGLILENDTPNPYKHGQYPFTPIFAYDVPGQFYGVGDAQNILGSNMMYNRTMQLLFDSIVKSGGGVLLLGAGSGLDAKAITNDPFQVRECTDVNQVRLMEMGSSARHEYNFLSTINNMVQDASGIHEVSKGAMMPGDMTAQEVAVMRDSDQTRVRKAQRNLTWSLNRVARQVMFNWAQWPDFEWLVNVSQTNENTPVPGTSGPSVSIPFDPKQLFKGEKLIDALRYHLRFVEGSTLPASLDQTKAQAWQLYNAGLFDATDLLQALQVPNATAIAQKAIARQSPASGPAGQAPPPPSQHVAESIGFKDLPPEGQTQMAAQAGIFFLL